MSQKTPYDEYNKWSCVSLARTWVTGAPPWSQAWGWGERLVAGPIPMGPGRAQPEEITWDPLPAGSPPAGGAKGVGCIVSWAAAEGGDLGGPILGCRS